MPRAICLLLLPLAACSGQAPDHGAASEAAAPSAVQNQVTALSDGERNAVFIRAIRDAGHDCQGVTGSQRRDDVSHAGPFWVARCTDGASYGVLITRDGTAEVSAAPHGG